MHWTIGEEDPLMSKPPSYLKLLPKVCFSQFHIATLLPQLISDY
jgi:hypothetical protein